jgi:hypothetical protein
MNPVIVPSLPDSQTLKHNKHPMSRTSWSPSPFPEHLTLDSRTHCSPFVGHIFDNAVSVRSRFVPGSQREQAEGVVWRFS